MRKIVMIGLGAVSAAVLGVAGIASASAAVHNSPASSTPAGTQTGHLRGDDSPSTSPSAGVGHDDSDDHGTHGDDGDDDHGSDDHGSGGHSDDDGPGHH